MKLTTKLILTFLASSLCSYAWVFAAWIDHFEVEFNQDTAKIWESLDLTIEAVDKNNTTVLDYEGTILIFSESDPEAELPSALEENTYTFSASDQWRIKFENSVKFKNSWLQNIHIYDLNDDTVFWIAETDIDKESIITNIDISIISPESGLTIWDDSIWVSWTTTKNHKVNIILNWTKEFSTTSNNDWIFEKIVEDLNDGENKIKAQVLDADLNVVWESNEVSLKVELDSLNIKNVWISPEEIEAESSFEIEIIANPGLDEVSIVLNDELILLEETDAWVYKVKAYAPKEPWTYKIDLKIKDELWHEKTELWAANITVNEVVLLVADETWTWVVAVQEDNPIIEEETDKLKITWLKVVELKSKSILTWNEIEDIEWYNVYKKASDWELELVENVETAKFEIEIVGDETEYEYFAVKAIAKTASWELYEWSLSDATKVKTGPEMIILLLLSLFLGWLVFIVKYNRA